MDPTGGYQSYEFVAELYDHIVPYKNRSDVPFFVEAAVESGGPVLELGCGTGRILIPTAKAGVDITGLDLSLFMLNVCREYLQKESEDVRSRIELIQDDMHNFDIKRLFKLITLPFRSFQHLLTVEDQIQCLECIHRHLDNDGKFILDIFNPSLNALANDNLEQELGDEPEFTMPDGRRVLRKFQTVSRDYFNQIQLIELIYYVKHADGKQERLIHSFPMRYLFRFEAEHLLTRCGFEVENVYSDYYKNPYGSQYPGELVVVAKKANIC